MKKIILLLLITYYIPVVYSQIRELAPGYILTCDGDTLHGYIKERNDIANTKGCLFSLLAEGKLKEYTTDEISEYKISGGKYYVAKKFDLNKEENHLFVEFLVNGIVNLYYFRMPDKERYLLEKAGEPLSVIEGEIIDTLDLTKDERLNEQAKYITSGSKSEVKFASSLKSQGLIAYFMKEDPTIQQKVRTLHYDQRSMIRLTKNYHNKVCKDYECVVYNKKTNLSKRSIGIFIGANIGSLIFNTDNIHFTNLVDVEIKRKLKPVIGLNYSSTIPYVHRHMCTDVSLSYSEHNFEYHYHGTSETITKFSYRQAAITGQLGYYIISQGKFKLNPSLGLSGILLYNGSNEREIIGGYDFGPYEIIPVDSKVLISVNFGLHSLFELNDKYGLKLAVLYEFIHDLDDMAVASNSHVFYFMMGISRSLNRVNKGEK